MVSVVSCKWYCAFEYRCIVLVFVRGTHREKLSLSLLAFISSAKILHPPPPFRYFLRAPISVPGSRSGCDD